MIQLIGIAALAYFGVRYVVFLAPPKGQELRPLVQVMIYIVMIGNALLLLSLLFMGGLIEH